ncbi:type VII secretion-associated serine protease mycosin [Streptomyces sp. NBC_01304]|uniref:type VII secretion-associated serine protease mycosin n=1 Tax=Streptomyces sp. NBC_01304 TaxID=2903818 RepID=UPI002E0ECCF2|nr:type VII secretion-associated serine protease mycosin [Streptomyces sp. NBC_01304]
MGVLTPRSRRRTSTSGTRALQRAFGVLAATGVCLASAPPAFAASGIPASAPAASDECEFGGENLKSTPWSLQRILLDQLREQATGEGVTVAVIDTGVDAGNSQLTDALKGPGKSYVGGKGNDDLEGHGTRVAGIIAARPMDGTGFAGIAPKAKILSFRYTGGADDKHQGNSNTMSDAIKDAVAAGADIINISSDTEKRKDNAILRATVANAVKDGKGPLIVAAAGNDGADGKSADTYPASYPGVLAVAASDRNDERAFFSQSGSFVDIAAPGMGMVSTVPKGGQCSSDGTSFAAPYVAGVAALLKEKHPGWTAEQIATRMQETAQRTGRGPNRYVGWGVVDPIAAVSDDSTPGSSPQPDPPVKIGAGGAVPMEVTMGESEAEKEQRIALYVLGATLLLVLIASGSGVALRDWQRKRGGSAGAGG